MATSMETWIASAVGRGMNPDALFGDWINTIGAEDAKDAFSKASSAYFEKVRNNPSDPNQIPPRGAILSFYGRAWNGGFGHIGVVTNASSTGFDLIQQNGFTPTEPAHLQHFNGYADVIGWLIPKSNQIKQGTQDVITADDTARVRIINTELAGYPFVDTHNGKFDAPEMAAWTGQPWQKLIDEKWGQGQTFRSRREAAFAQVDSQQRVIDGLSSQVTKLQTQISTSELQAQASPTPPTPGTLVTPDTSKASETPVNPSKDTTQAEPLKEAVKEVARLGVLGGISFGITKLTALPDQTEFVMALTGLLRSADKYVHENPNIPLKGLLWF